MRGDVSKKMRRLLPVSTSAVSTQPPERSRSDHPHDAREPQRQRGRMSGQCQPRHKSETHKAPSPEHGTRGIERSSLAPASRVVDRGFQLLVGLVPGDQCGTRRKDRGEGQEQATDDRTSMLRHDARAGGDRSAEYEAHGELPPVRIPETGEIDGRDHLSRAPRMSPAAIAASPQMPRPPSETNIGDQRRVASACCAV